MPHTPSSYDVPPRATMVSTTLHAIAAPRCNVHVLEGRSDAGAVSLMIRDGLQSVSVHVPRNAGDLTMFAASLREAAEKYRQEAAILRAAELAGLALAEEAAA